MMRSNAVVSLVDDNTALDYLVMMHSLQKNNPDLYQEVDKYIFTFGGLCDENLQLIKKRHPEIQERKITSKKEKYNIKYDGDREWCDGDLTTYRPHYRYEILNLTGYDNLVYLDTDLLVVGDIRELFTTPEGKVGVCKKWNVDYITHHPCYYEYSYTSGGAPDNLDSFNGGVLSFGKGVPTLRMSQRLIKFQEEMQSAGNQQPLNKALQGHTFYYPPKYNFATENFSILEKIEDQAIIHFVGKKKPSHCFIPVGDSLQHTVVIESKEDTQRYDQVEKTLNISYHKVLERSFGSYQLNLLGTNNCLALWYRWFNTLKDSGLWIKKKKDILYKTREVFEND